MGKTRKYYTLDRVESTELDGALAVLIEDGTQLEVVCDFKDILGPIRDGVVIYKYYNHYKVDEKETNKRLKSIQSEFDSLFTK